MEKILIIQTAFIGDVVLATVIAEKIHASLPEAEIDFLLRGGNEGLLKGHPFIHEVLIWNKKKNKQKNLFKIIAYIRQKKYDRVINVQRFFSTGLITALSGAKEKVGFQKNPLSIFFTLKLPHIISSENTSMVHETDRNLLLVKHFTKDLPAKMRLYPGKEDVEFVEKYKVNTYICVAPSSVWFTKQYPEEKWISFLRKVPGGITIFLLGAGSDHELCERIKTALENGKAENLCGQLSYLASASLMQDALMNYVNDSAPLHFASAVNAPVTAVYCSTVPRFGFYPLSIHSSIVEIEYPLYCRPCGLHGKKACPEGHFRCALEIKDEQLMDSLFVNRQP